MFNGQIRCWSIPTTTHMFEAFVVTRCAAHGGRLVQDKAEQSGSTAVQVAAANGQLENLSVAFSLGRGQTVSYES